MKKNLLSAAEISSGDDWEARTADAKWICYRPPGTKIRRICAAVWLEDTRVHWYCPLLSFFDTLLDPQPFILFYPCAGGQIGPFERAMEWLDSICYGAASVDEVRVKLSEEPEWGLRWLPDGESSKSSPWMSPEEQRPRTMSFNATSMRDCVIQSLRTMIAHDEVLLGAQIDCQTKTEFVHDIAELQLKTGQTVLITAIHDIRSQDVVRQGILSMDRMRFRTDTYQHALLIVPTLAISRLVSMSKMVTICAMDFGNLRAAITDISKKFEVRYAQ